MHTAVQWLLRAEILLLNVSGDGDPTNEQVLECIRAALLKMEPARQILGASSPPLSLEAEHMLDIQTAMSQWLYGRMMDEDACTSILRIARTSAGLWSFMTSPDAARIQPPSIWHQALYADAIRIFGHHFKP